MTKRTDMPGMLTADEQNNPFEGAPSFSLRHRLLRMLWQVSWTLLAAWTPPQLHRWRIWLANRFGANIHSTCSLYSSVRIWYPPHLTMDRFSALGRGVNCYSMAPIMLEAYSIVSQDASLCTGTHDIHHPAFQIMAKPIVVGANSWICAEAFVGPGVTVGEGAVLAARAAAFRNLDPWTVYLGNPATIKGSRTRFERA